jgi:hypothetical protein
MAEEELLNKIYECQDILADLLNNGKNDKYYFLILDIHEALIKSLEESLANKHGII